VDDDTIAVSVNPAREGAIVRCSVSEATCETATAPSKQVAQLSRPAYE
jgi:hypothetical protein